MTRDEFESLCISYTVDPAIALENENVVAFLRARDEEGVWIALEQLINVEC